MFVFKVMSRKGHSIFSWFWKFEVSTTNILFKSNFKNQGLLNILEYLFLLQYSRIGDEEDVGILGLEMIPARNESLKMMRTIPEALILVQIW